MIPCASHRFAHATRRLSRFQTASRTQPDSAPLWGGSPAVPVPLAAAQSKKT